MPAQPRLQAGCETDLCSVHHNTPMEGNNHSAPMLLTKHTESRVVK